MKKHPNLGIYIALLVVVLWGVCLALGLQHRPALTDPLTYLLFFLQAHLYTGVFITAHDAMHGVVAPGRKRLNHSIGAFAAGLFLFNFYPTLLRKHHLHHQHVATEGDPDFHPGGFWRWYLGFAREYFNPWQILAVAVTYNLLKLAGLPWENLVIFWMLPAVLSTFQLFYFGTYLPHRHQPDNPHRSRSQGKNHLWAFLSCYFFGYHYEHHDKPGTPWWMLWQEKERNAARR